MPLGQDCFNPCFCGRYSAIKPEDVNNMVVYEVSILVLVEGTLQWSNISLI